MAQMNESGVRAFPATVAGVKGTAVKFSGVNIVVAAAATDDILGVLDVDHSVGAQANVRLRSASGTSIGLSGAAVSVGDRLTSNATGKLIATTTAQDEIVGIALEAASGADAEFEFMNSTGTV